MLSEDEKRRYDRQVRVWGAKSQLRIQNSKVFLAGFVGLNVEVAKNLVLAGVNVSLQDTRVVSAEMLSNNFFITEDDIGKSVVAASLPRLQNLNPFAQISTMQCPIDDLDDQYLSEYDVILLSDVYESTALHLNSMFRKHPGKVMFWSASFGSTACFLADFGDHFEYSPDVIPSSNNSNSNNHSNSSAASKSTPKALEPKSISFPSFQTVVDKHWNEMESKLFPLSPIFLQFRILETYRNSYHEYPSLLNKDKLMDHVRSLCTVHQVDINKITDKDIHQLLSTATPHFMMSAVVSCSILGSFLAQEVIKALTWCGEPGNTFWQFSADSIEVKAIPLVSRAV